MQVLKTTSPFCACPNGAPKRIPSKVAPDSRASRPRASDTGVLLRKDRHSRGILMDHATTSHGEQHGAPQSRAEQRRVARARVERLLADGPLGVRIEERARRRLADAQPGFGDA